MKKGGFELKARELLFVIASGSEAIQLMFGEERHRLHCTFSFGFNWIASRSLAMTARCAAKPPPSLRGDPKGRRGNPWNDSEGVWIATSLSSFEKRHWRFSFLLRKNHSSLLLAMTV